MCGGYPGPLLWPLPWQLPLPLLGGYPGQLPWWPLLGGVPWSTSMMTTSGVGVPWSTSMMTTSVMTTSGGIPWSTSMMTTSVMTTSMMTTSGGGGYPSQLPWWPLLWWPLPWWPLPGGVPWSTSVMTTSMMTTSLMTTSGGYPGQPPWWPLLGGYPGQLPWWPLLWWPLGGGTLVNFHDDHFWGYPGQLPWWPLPWYTHDHFHDDHFHDDHFHDDHFHDDHFWGVPCDLSHNAVHVISALQTPKWWVWLGAHAYIVLPQRIVGRSHGTPPWTDWQTNMSESFTFPHTTYAVGNKFELNPIWYKAKPIEHKLCIIIIVIVIICNMHITFQ